MTKRATQFDKNYKTLMNEIKEKLIINKWRDTPCLWTTILSIVKISIFSNLIIDARQSQSKF